MFMHIPNQECYDVFYSKPKSNTSRHYTRAILALHGGVQPFMTLDCGPLHVLTGSTIPVYKNYQHVRSRDSSIRSVGCIRFIYRFILFTSLTSNICIYFTSMVYLPIFTDYCAWELDYVKCSMAFMTYEIYIFTLMIIFHI